MNAFILSNDSELRTLVSRICAMRNPPINVLAALPSMHADPIPPVSGQPDLVILDASSYGSGSMDVMQRVAEAYPQAGIMLLSSDRSPEYLISAMRAGVREVLPLPLSVVEMDAALDRVMQKFSIIAPLDGKVIAFIATKGGSGATFIAANLSHALSLLAQKRVLLIDLNPVFGDAALYVSDAKPGRTLTDVCREINRLDLNLLESSVIRLSATFSVLAASDNPDPQEDIRPDQIETIIQLARRHYDYVLLDLGRQINPVSIRALDQSDLIYPVLQQSLPHLRDCRRLLDIFHSLGYRNEKIQLVLNRFESSAVLGVGEIERVLDQRIAHRIPNNYDVANESINQGTPVLQLARSSTIAKALAEWVNRLTEASPAIRSSSIIRRIFVRNPAGSELTR